MKCSTAGRAFPSSLLRRCESSSVQTRSVRREGHLSSCEQDTTATTSEPRPHPTMSPPHHADCVKYSGIGYSSRHNQDACSDSYCSSEACEIRLSLSALRNLAEWYQLFTKTQGGNACLTQELSPPAHNAASGSSGESGSNGGGQADGTLAENSARRKKRRPRHDDKNDSADTFGTGGEA